MLVRLGADGYFEAVTGHAIYLSIENQRVSLVLMGWDLIEGTDQTDASLDADNCAGEVDLIHVLVDPYRVPLQKPAGRPKACGQGWQFDIEPRENQRGWLGARGGDAILPEGIKRGRES